MPVDPQIQILLDKGTGVPATHTLSVPEARAQYEARVALMAPPAAVAKVDERRIAGPGGPLRLRVYRPLGTGPFPLLVFFHGSGFVLCSLDTHDGMCRNLCAGAGCVVVSVDYRLAPPPHSTIACSQRAGQYNMQTSCRRMVAGSCSRATVPEAILRQRPPCACETKADPCCKASC
jgi:hypothetical protein